MTLALLTPAPNASAVDVTHYIAPWGNDLNPGTFEAPWRTFTQSLPKLYPGATLIARGGRYPEDVRFPTIIPGLPLPGRQTNVVDYGGEVPVIEGLLWLENPSYWTFRGINVTWRNGAANEHMVKINNGVGWTFHRSEIWGARSFGAFLVTSTKANEPSDWTIHSNCIHDTHPTNGPNQDHLIYVNSGPTGTGGLIHRNLLFNSPNGHAVHVAAPASGSPGPANVTVSYNTMHQNVHQVFVAWQAANNRFYRNLAVTARQGTAPKANFRGFSLTGPGNTVYNNAGHDGLTNPPALIENTGPGQGLINGGGNIYPVGDPQFNAGGCKGYRPGNQTAQFYGHWAP